MLKRPCESTCKFGAIKAENGKSLLTRPNVKIAVCVHRFVPYQAIAKNYCSCENARPVGAIAKDEDGHARIEF